MKPFGPFDAVGAIALEIERMSGFAQGQRDFSLGTVEDWPDPEKELTRMQEARFDGYWDGWMLSYSAHCKRLTRKTEEV